MTRIELAVLDMAGTTVSDDGAVERAFVTAARHVGLAADDADLDRMMTYVRDTMGQSKITVFTHLAGGDARIARQANTAFEAAYAEGVTASGCMPLPGTIESFARLRAAGVKIALTTGFSRTTADTILDALGWHALIDVSLTPLDAGRGRPFPDLPLTALLRTEASSVRAMAVVGDTTWDVESGLRAGARIAAGVLTGAHDAERLTAAGATAVFADVQAFTDAVLAT